MNYDSISKTGTFIVRVEFMNEERQILKNLTSIEVISDNILFSNKLYISLNKVKNDKIKVYYSTKSLEELNIQVQDKKLHYENNFNFDDVTSWTPITLNQELPKNITCIATNVEELDRTHSIFYEFEITLKENRDHKSYSYYTYPICDNENVCISYKTQIRNKHKWNSSTVKKILLDEVYIGNLVQFKTTTVSYKNHTVIYNDKDRQIRAEDTHEPTIGLDLWYSVQEKLSQSKKSCKDGKVHILANKVYCEECNRVFCKCGKNDYSGYAYLCCKDKATKWSNCNNKKYIKETFLHDYVLGKINNLLNRFYNEEQQFEMNDNMVESDLFKDQIHNLTKEKENISKELKSKSSYFQDLYEDLKREFLTEEEYMSMRSKYQEDFAKLNERLQTIETSLLGIQAKQSKLKDKKTLFLKYKQIKELDVEIVNDFIDRIVIGEYNEETDQRKIHIVWNFAD